MKKPIIVFDLDGTLIDSATEILKNLNLCLTEVNLCPFTQADISKLVGMGGRVMLQRALSARSQNASPSEVDVLLKKFLTYYERNIPGDTTLYPGVERLLETLKVAGFQCAVCSNKNERAAVKTLDSFKIRHYFSAVCGGDTFPWRKPDPRHIEATIAQANGDKNNAVMIGDSEADIVAAKNAGLPCIAVSFGYSDKPANELDATLVIDSFSELTVMRIVDILKQKRNQRISCDF